MLRWRLMLRWQRQHRMEGLIMPRLPVSAERSLVVSWTMVDYSGAKRAKSIRIRGTGVIADPAGALLLGTNIIQNVGDASNAAVVRGHVGFDFRVDPACDEVIVFDEAYASVDRVGTMQWRDGLGQWLYLGIPAIDASKLMPDRRTINTSDTNMAAILADVNTLLALTASPNYDPCYSKSFLSRNSGRFARTPSLPAIAEPGELDEPGDAPALPAP